MKNRSRQLVPANSGKGKGGGKTREKELLPSRETGGKREV